MSEREMIKQAYPKRKEWHSKLDKMPDNQIHAIYMRLKNKGKV